MPYGKMIMSPIKRRGKDMRPFIGADWWEHSVTKYNKDGSVFRKQSNSPGRFYTWFVLQPTNERTSRILVEFLVGIVMVFVATFVF